MSDAEKPSVPSSGHAPPGPSETVTQADVIAFLSDPANHTERTGEARRAVDVIETHGAIVFLMGDEALKIKRAIKLAYLDFSTLAHREAVCRRELEINRPNAPEIYRGVVAITREADGRLAIGGRGEVVEWAVRMARFDQRDLLTSIAERRGIDDALAASLAATVLAAHAAAKPAAVAGAADRIRAVLQSVVSGIEAAAVDVPGAGEGARKIGELGGMAIERCAATLERRAEAGLVRRCHGDLHLGNIVLWRGRPTLFDAIEFDETLATIDVLYDLAFLLMDLDRRGQARAAHIVLDRYLAGSGRGLDIDGLAALPVFLGLRAAVRALVALDRARTQPEPKRATTERHAIETLERALALLQPPPPRLVAVGGLSGTGKTTLAANLAPLLLPVPGALHVRSDVVRKGLAGVGELDRLPPEAYTPEAAARVYAELVARAVPALAAGHSVVVDAVFAKPDDRAAFGKVAAEAGVRFDGIWLGAPTEVLKARVAARTHDASDATPAVVERQAAEPVGALEWHRIAAGGDPADVLALARDALGLTSS